MSWISSNRSLCTLKTDVIIINGSQLFQMHFPVKLKHSLANMQQVSTPAAATVSDSHSRLYRNIGKWDIALTLVTKGAALRIVNLISPIVPVLIVVFRRLYVTFSCIWIEECRRLSNHISNTIEYHSFTLNLFSISGSSFLVILSLLWFGVCDLFVNVFSLSTLLFYIIHCKSACVHVAWVYNNM